MADKTILVAENEQSIASSIQHELQSIGYGSPVMASTGEEAVEKALELKPDLILMDIKLSGIFDGIEATKRIHSHMDVPVIYLAANNDDHTLQRAQETSPFGYLLKPFQERELSRTIEKALYKARMESALRESEKRYRSIINAVTDYIFTVRIENGIPVETIHGPTCVDVTGYTPGDFSNDPYLWINMVYFEDREAVKNQSSSILKGLADPLEHRIVRKDGRIRWVRDIPVVHYDRLGNMISYDGLIQDITCRKRAEGTLRTAREELEHKIRDRTADLLMVKDLLSRQTEKRRLAEDDLRKRTHHLDSRVKELNCLYGISELFNKQDLSVHETLQGVVKLIPPAWQFSEITCARISLGEQEFITENFRETAFKQKSTIVVQGQRAGSVEVFYLEKKPGIYEGPFLKEERRLINAVSEQLGRMIDQKQAKKGRRFSSQDLHSISIENLPQEIFYKIEEEKTRIEAALQDNITKLSIKNEISEVLLSTRDLTDILHMILIGATASQALGFNRAFLFLINEEENMLEGTVATGPLSIHEAYTTWGKLAQEEHTLTDLLQPRNGHLSHVDAPINNLVQQMKIPLQKTDRIFTRAVYEGKSFNVNKGADNPFIDKEFIRLLGTDCFAVVPLVARGKSLGVLLADNFINQKPIGDKHVETLREFANHASLAIENSRLYQRLQEKVEELSRAYTELQLSRDQLLHYERLSAVGKLAAQVAHDIRNPLTAIGGFARRIQRRDQDEKENKKYLNIIVQEIDRLERILSDLLCFVSPGPPQPDSVDLNSIIKSACEMLALEIENNHITIEENLGPHLPMLYVDNDQIRRVVINLIKNALDSMPDGGMITFSTIAEDHWVRVEIADTGTGISDDAMDKLFDPFFTSKATGSGLGLTLADQTIKRHGGSIAIQKREPKGTLVSIRLPIEIKEPHDAD